jgi:hypothetical protein
MRGLLQLTLDLFSEVAAPLAPSGIAAKSDANQPLAQQNNAQAAPENIRVPTAKRAWLTAS